MHNANSFKEVEVSLSCISKWHFLILFLYVHNNYKSLTGYAPVKPQPKQTKHNRVDRSKATWDASHVKLYAHVGHIYIILVMRIFLWPFIFPLPMIYEVHLL